MAAPLIPATGRYVLARGRDRVVIDLVRAEHAADRADVRDGEGWLWIEFTVVGGKGTPTYWTALPSHLTPVGEI